MADVLRTAIEHLMADGMLFSTIDDLVGPARVALAQADVSSACQGNMTNCQDLLWELCIPSARASIPMQS